MSENRERNQDNVDKSQDKGHRSQNKGDESLDREYENHKEKISFRTKVLGVKTENKEKDESLYEGYENKY